MASLATPLARAAAPVVAILRGVPPQQVLAIGGALVEAGIRIIEVPLNGTEPLKCIALLREASKGDVLVGAGTVLRSSEVTAAAEAGAQLIVSPNTDTSVIARTLDLGLESMPGFQSPTEAFIALAAGARRLKLFPAASLGVAHLKALREVLPHDAELWPVGGIGAHDFAQWLSAGAAGVGAGSSLYRPGDSPAEVNRRALALVAIWKKHSA